MADFNSIIKEQKEEFKKIEGEENIIVREKSENAKILFQHPNILAIFGIRLCGKSIFFTFLQKIAMQGILMMKGLLT